MYTVFFTSVFLSLAVFSSDEIPHTVKKLVAPFSYNLQLHWQSYCLYERVYRISSAFLLVYSSYIHPDIFCYCNTLLYSLGAETQQPVKDEPWEFLLLAQFWPGTSCIYFEKEVYMIINIHTDIMCPVWAVQMLFFLHVTWSVCWSVFLLAFLSVVFSPFGLTE